MNKTSAPGQSRVVTLAQIAKEVNLSRSGVSRALRNDPSIPEGTCLRVQEVARKLGFVSDNRISRAYSMIRLNGRSTFRGTLGFLNAYPYRAHSPTRPVWYLTSLFESARKRAEELGYRLDEISLGDPKLTPGRIHSILEARGIQGLLIPPLPDDIHELPIDWKQFICVAITHSLVQPNLHRVTPNQYQNMLLAVQGLADRGYRRIGFLIWNEFALRVNYAFHGAFLTYQYNIDPADRIPIFEPDGDFEPGFDEWFHKNQPDAIIGCHPNIVEVIDRHNLLNGPKPVAFVSLGGSYESPNHRLHRKVTYICQNTSDVARTGIDLLVAQADRREIGVPHVASSVQIAGKWTEGITTPRINHTKPFPVSSRNAEKVWPCRWIPESAAAS